MVKKNFKFNPTAAAEEGAQHRTEIHLGAPESPLKEAGKVAAPKKKPGPAKAFGGAPLRRLSAFIPESLARRINAEAVQAGQTIGEYLAARLYGEGSKESDPVVVRR